MDCNVLSIPKNSCISRLVTCNVSRVLLWISLAKNKSSMSGTVYTSLFLSVILSLVAALEDLFYAGDVLSMPVTFFIANSPPNVPVNVLMFLVQKTPQCIS